MKNLVLVFAIVAICCFGFVGVSNAGNGCGVVFQNGGCVSGGSSFSFNGSFGHSQVLQVPASNLSISSGVFSLPAIEVRQQPVIVQQAAPVIIQQRSQRFHSFGSSGVNVNVNSNGFRPFGFLNVRRGLFGRTVVRGRF